jgi:hypothetical protein
MAENAVDCPSVGGESIRGDQGWFDEIRLGDGLGEQPANVPVAASANNTRWPQARVHFQHRDNPRDPLLAIHEVPDLVGLEFSKCKALQTVPTESVRGGRRLASQVAAPSAIRDIRGP